MSCTQKRLEWVAEIWDNGGECLQIGEDRDGLDMTEIRWRDGSGKVAQSVTFTDDMLPLVIEALQKRLARAAQGIETCGRPGCTAERRPSDGRAGRVRRYVHRPTARAQWDDMMVPRCTGASLAKPRRSRTIDRGDEY